MSLRDLLKGPTDDDTSGWVAEYRRQLRHWFDLTAGCTCGEWPWHIKPEQHTQDCAARPRLEGDEATTALAAWRDLKERTPLDYSAPHDFQTIWFVQDLLAERR